MRGLMQHDQLMISDLLRHAARHHPHGEIVSRMGDFSIHRQSWPDTERRARRLANALAEIGVSPGDRVATLAWNGFRHVELYFAISGSGAVVNTVNPRLASDDIAYIIAHAEDGVLFAETDFAGLVAGIAPKLTNVLRHVVFLCDEAALPDVTLPDGIAVSAYESLLDAASETYDWPRFDERTASVLCYTSGTTGLPKGVRIGQASLLNYVSWLRATGWFDCAPRTVLLNPPWFDLGYTALFGALLLSALKGIDDGDGKSALYNSTVLLGMECWSDSANGHYLKNIPFILAGVYLIYSSGKTPRNHGAQAAPRSPGSSRTHCPPRAKRSASRGARLGHRT